MDKRTAILGFEKRESLCNLAGVGQSHQGEEKVNRKT